MQDQLDILISGRYRLLKRLQRGGMSEVFLALDEQAQQQVAIKIVTNSDSDCIKRLQREVRILRKLSHPHILPLLDDGIFDSYYYLVMPYMQRGNLRERLMQGKMMPQEAGIILHQLTDALAYAHKQGVIHRDIKPSNILLDTTDACHIYLADFGIAKILEEGSDITQTGILVGTPEYMAPELAEKPESASSDIYAAGVLLYQMLTGRLPFTGTSPLAICWKHIKEQPTPPSSLNAEISPVIEKVILCAMQKNPRQRFAEAGAMSLAYANALSGFDQMPALHDILPINLSGLAPAHVTLRKMEKGFNAKHLTWQNSVGRAIQRGVLGSAALVMLALPVSLGVIFAHAGGSQVNQPMEISRAFVNGTMAGNVLPTMTTMPALDGGGISSAPTAYLSDLDPIKIKTQPLHRNTPQSASKGHGHKHKQTHSED
jgi:serine/threonine protein kinase